MHVYTSDPIFFRSFFSLIFVHKRKIITQVYFLSVYSIFLEYEYALPDFVVVVFVVVCILYFFICMIIMCWHSNFSTSKMYLQLFVGYYTNLLFSVQLSEQNVVFSFKQQIILLQIIPLTLSLVQVILKVFSFLRVNMSSFYSFVKLSFML